MDKTKKLVLTIEDQPAIAELLGFLLDATELEVKRSDNGAEGLEMIQKLKPDLVIMDVMMPVMDGWQVFDAVRTNEATQNIPIIMLSVARQDAERRVAFRGSNLDFYMTKPFDVVSLRRLVQEVLGLEIWIKSTQAIQPPTSTPPSPTDTSTSAPETPTAKPSDSASPSPASPAEAPAATPTPTSPIVPPPNSSTSETNKSATSDIPEEPPKPSPSVPPEPSPPPQVKE